MNQNELLTEMDVLSIIEDEFGTETKKKYYSHDDDDVNGFGGC